jgi:phage gpG-like protein
MTVEVKLVVDKQSSAQVQRKLKQLRSAISGSGGGGAGGMRNANRNVSLWLLRWVNDNFKTEGGKVGNWKPFTYGGRLVKKGTRGASPISLLPSKRRAYINPSAKLLQDTGALRLSFDVFHSQKNAGVGSDLKYAAAHEQGLPSRNLPQRRMLPESGDKDVTQGIIKIYDAYIRKVTNKRVS